MDNKKTIDILGVELGSPTCIDFNFAGNQCSVQLSETNTVNQLTLESSLDASKDVQKYIIRHIDSNPEAIALLIGLHETRCPTRADINPVSTFSKYILKHRRQNKPLPLRFELSPSFLMSIDCLDNYKPNELIQAIVERLETSGYSEAAYELSKEEASTPLEEVRLCSKYVVLSHRMPYIDQDFLFRCVTYEGGCPVSDRYYTAQCACKEYGRLWWYTNWELQSPQRLLVSERTYRNEGGTPLQSFSIVRIADAVKNIQSTFEKSNINLANTATLNDAWRKRLG